MTEIPAFERINRKLLDRLRDIGAATIAGTLAKKASALLRESEEIAKKTEQ